MTLHSRKLNLCSFPYPCDGHGWNADSLNAQMRSDMPGLTGIIRDRRQARTGRFREPVRYRGHLCFILTLHTDLDMCMFYSTYSFLPSLDVSSYLGLTFNGGLKKLFKICLHPPTPVLLTLCVCSGVNGVWALVTVSP